MKDTQSFRTESGESATPAIDAERKIEAQQLALEAAGAALKESAERNAILAEALSRLLGAYESDKNIMPNMTVLTSWETNGQSIARARAALGIE